MSTPISIFTIPDANHLPTPPEVYLGRESQVNLILEYLTKDRGHRSDGKVCVVHGPDGIGKTGLCQVVSNRLHEYYSDGQVYIKVEVGDTGAALLHKVFELIIHLFEPFAHLSDDIEALHVHYLSVLNENKVLIVLDDVQSTEDLHPLIPPSSCALLIASKEPFENPNGISLHLTGLSERDSEELLIYLCPRIGQFASDLSRICENNPFLLRFIGSYLAENPSIHVVDCIRELEERLKGEKDDGQDETFLMDQLLGLGFEKLQPTEKQFFLQLGIIPQGFKAEMVEEIAKSIFDDKPGNETVMQFIAALVRMNYLEYDEGPKYYRMHPSIQKFAETHIENESATWIILASIYADLVEEFRSLANRNADGFLLSLLLFDEHKSNIRKIIQFLQAHSAVSLDRLKLALFSLVNLFGRCRFLPNAEVIPIMEIEVDAALRLNDVDQLLSILKDLSKIYLALGEKARSLDYSYMGERIIRGRQEHNENQTLGEIRAGRDVDLTASEHKD